MESVPEEMIEAMQAAKHEIFGLLTTDVLLRFKIAFADYAEEAKENFLEDHIFWCNGVPKEHNAFGEGIKYKKLPKSGYIPLLEFCTTESNHENLTFYQRALDLERLADADDYKKYLVLFGRVYVKYIMDDSELYVNIAGRLRAPLIEIYERYKADIIKEQAVRGFAPNDLVGALEVAKSEQHRLLYRAFGSFKTGKDSKKDYKAAPEGRENDFTFWVKGEPKKYKKTGAGKTYKKFPKSGYKKYLQYCEGEDAELAKAIEFHQRALEIESFEDNREKYLTLVGASEYEGILSTKAKKKSDLNLSADAKKKLAKAIKKYSDEIAAFFSE
mmetsp:Transcript_12465/g.20692  ORF Transcript_12465/g.20692 Transcript_12465/m.20692 type:complete len:329 (+) Transcript_12465:127-1113(+)|eukprot:CAMPEP_0119027388 /NCGR_PEP_ID=MMETSP1176-20130426/37021_1 /TAXON_ID=265551 /ORGANISM="Synedropsis recta cf, Strain CCMP1620" /LENGTH=328 /DNA_ID=CAMNT_0006983299 /DNA_START=81 /DNA_END=1067 /DNA_ORIENTATION=-